MISWILEYKIFHLFSTEQFEYVKAAGNSTSGSLLGLLLSIEHINFIENTSQLAWLHYAILKMHNSKSYLSPKYVLPRGHTKPKLHDAYIVIRNFYNVASGS